MKDLEQLINCLKKDVWFTKKYGNKIAFFAACFEGSDELLELLKGKKWSIQADGDFVILWVEIE